MSEYLNYQQLSLKLASISAEKESLIHQQPKLKNLTTLLEEERLETQRYKEQVLILQRQLELAKCKLGRLKEQQKYEKRDIMLNSASDEESLNEKELIGRTDKPEMSVQNVIPGISNQVLENLVRELAICKRELKKFVDGQDMKTFLEAAEYEESIKKYQEMIKEKDNENDKLRAEIKERDLEGGQNDFKNRQKLEEEIAALKKSLSVKTVLVSALTQELEKTEKKCSEVQEKYYKEIESLREEKKLLNKHKLDDSQIAEEAAALQAKLYQSQQEKTTLKRELDVFKKELSIRSEDLSAREHEIIELNIQNKGLQQKTLELEVKLRSCDNCVKLGAENEELKQEAESNKDYMELMTTQMKTYEEDFKHERKDREDLKSSYDRKVDEQQRQISVLSQELHRIKEMYRKQKEQNEWLQSRQHQSVRSPDIVTDMPGPRFSASTCQSYAYGQQRHTYRQHTALPSEVVVDTGDADPETPDNNGASSLASHIPRECPRCEREFAPHEREEFEKHVEKCVH